MRSDMNDVVDALDAAAGTTCLVGAGGKKTTLYALADRLDRAVLTATVRIPIFDREVAAVRVTEGPRGRARRDRGGRRREGSGGRRRADGRTRAVPCSDWSRSVSATTDTEGTTPPSSTISGARTTGRSS